MPQLPSLNFCFALCCVMTGGYFSTTERQQLKVNDICHDKGICYVSCDARGVFAYAFCDFGESFVVSDVDGNQVGNGER